MSRTEAIAASGLSQRTFARRESQGHIKGHYLDGRKWYDAADVERLAEAPDEDDPLAWAMSTLRTTQGHCESLIRTITDPQKAANSHQVAMVEMQGKRIEYLEARWQETLVAHETLMSLQSERELKLAKSKLNQETRAKMLDLVREHGPGLIERISGARDVLNVLRKWARTEIPDTLLKADGFLDDADKEWFGGLIARLRAEERERKGAAANEQQSKAASDNGGVPASPGTGSPGESPAAQGSDRRRTDGDTEGAGGGRRQRKDRRRNRHDGGSETVT